MTSENDARAWLRATGYSEIADQIDGVMDGWRARGVETRRNWWDVLAGTEKGFLASLQASSFQFLARLVAERTGHDVTTRSRQGPVRLGQRRRTVVVGTLGRHRRACLMRVGSSQ